MKNELYYGDNLEILQKHIQDESVDLCYIDPPFNSKRTYNQIYNQIGEDKAQSQAFIDTWTWSKRVQAEYESIITGNQTFSHQTIKLIKGFKEILGTDSLFSYLVSMTTRVNEIHRILKPTGSFYLHCDPTASHYLKIMLDSVFCARKGEFLNEIVWCYTTPSTPYIKQFPRNSDTIFWYSKSNKWLFNKEDIRVPYKGGAPHGGKGWQKEGESLADWRLKQSQQGKFPSNWWNDIYKINNKERLGYPTQKPLALLDRIIKASSNEGDVVLDAFCGCGTTADSAYALGRQFIGIDITYQSIALVLKRLEDRHGKEIIETIKVNGIPKDIASAKALALKKDDRLRKEFEKWAVLTYTNNQGIVNDTKGADGGIDGTLYFGVEGNAKAVIQVKSGKVGRGDIAKLNSDRQRENAACAFFITLQKPTKPMADEVNTIGNFKLSEATGITLGDDSRPIIKIITVEAMMKGERSDLLTMMRSVVKKATPQKTISTNKTLDF